MSPLLGELALNGFLLVSEPTFRWERLLGG